ncbi:MAG: hypothetical protein WBP26_05425 [Candidatus Saccharimonadales bacterium]
MSVEIEPWGFVGDGFGPSAQEVYAHVHQSFVQSGLLPISPVPEGAPIDSGVSVAEQCTAEELERKFYDALQPPETVREEARRIVRGEAQARRYTDLACFSDEEIQAALGYIEWELFADPSDHEASLPKGIVANMYGIRWAERSPQLAGDAAVSIYSATFAPSANSRIAELYSGHVSTGEAAGHVADFIGQHPFYQTLAAFAQESRTTRRRPLTHYEKNLATATIAAEVHERHGVQATDHPDLRQAASREISWRVLALDDTTVPARMVDAAIKDPFVKAKRYIDSLLAHNPDLLGVWSNFVDQSEEARDLTAAYVLERATGSYDGSMPSVRLLPRILNLYTKVVMDNICTKSLPRNAALDSDEELADYDILLNRSYPLELSEQYIASEYEQRGHILTILDGFPNFQTYAQASLINRLGGVVSAPALRGMRTSRSILAEVSDPENTTSVICDKNVMRGEPYAVVLESRLPANAPYGMRLLAPLPVGANDLAAPAAGIQYDLVIQKGSRMLELFTVAGFRPVARDGDKIYFAYDAKNDPYAPAHVPLPADKLAVLIGQYEAAGLGLLAKSLRKRQPQTVEELQDRLAEKASYAPFGKQPKEVNARTIAELAAVYAKNGVMRYQCTGAAQLLKLSLQQVFGKDSARTVGGQVFDVYSRRIGPAGHEKVSFIHEGNQYYLDATPHRRLSMAGLNMLRERTSSFGNVVLRQFATQLPVSAQEPVIVPSPPKVPSFEPGVVDSSASERALEFTKDQADAETVELREKQLMPILYAYLGVPHAEGSRDKLYKEVMRLPEGDPSRRVLEMTHRLPAGNMTAEEVEKLREYIHNIQRSGPSSPLFTLIDHQSPVQLKALENIVERAAAILSKIT